MKKITLLSTTALVGLALLAAPVDAQRAERAIQNSEVSISTTEKEVKTTDRVRDRQRVRNNFHQNYQAEYGLVNFWDNERIAKRLDLSDQQVEALAESHQITKETIQSTREELQTLRRQMREEMSKETPELDRVYELFDQISALQNQNRRSSLGHMVAVRGILTADQQEEVGNIRRHMVRQNADRPATPDRPERPARPNRPDRPGQPDRPMNLDRDAMAEHHQNIRQILQDGGNSEDVKKYLESNDIPSEARDRVLRRVESMDADRPAGARDRSERPERQRPNR